MSLKTGLTYYTAGDSIWRGIWKLLTMLLFEWCMEFYTRRNNHRLASSFPIAPLLDSWRLFLKIVLTNFYLWDSPLHVECVTKVQQISRCSNCSEFRVINRLQFLMLRLSLWASCLIFLIFWNFWGITSRSMTFNQAAAMSNGSILLIFTSEIASRQRNWLAKNLTEIWICRIDASKSAPSGVIDETVDCFLAGMFSASIQHLKSALSAVAFPLCRR